MRKTVFWPMIDPFYRGKITKQQLIKNEVDLETIMNCFDTSKKKFVFGEMEMSITEDDVKEIFDLPTEGEELKFNKKLEKKDEKVTRLLKTVNQDYALKVEVQRALTEELAKEKEKNKKDGAGKIQHKFEGQKKEEEERVYNEEAKEKEEEETSNSGDNGKGNKKLKNKKLI
ncbi:uncharacterized protein LOC133730638 [Rosa rugosa]|uniref:uncharacterized protein LOC133730638 n=1 Tax=Rosa rugosa TaxID=74645 RepID=UPI002B4128C9|nr:uncharacterized protein LOC133730638 [Rosa rugosa]